MLSPYLVNPVKNSSLGMIGVPSAALQGEISKAARMEATAIHILESAR